MPIAFLSVFFLHFHSFHQTNYNNGVIPFNIKTFCMQKHDTTENRTTQQRKTDKGATTVRRFTVS